MSETPEQLHNHSETLVYRRSEIERHDTLRFAHDLGEKLQILAVGLTATLQNVQAFLPHDVHQTLMFMNVLVKGSPGMAVGTQAPILSLEQLVVRVREIMSGAGLSPQNLAPKEPTQPPAAVSSNADDFGANVVDMTNRFLRRATSAPPPDAPESA